MLRLLVAIPFVLIVTAGAAWAYWASAGAGTASASVGTINAPTAVAASNTLGTTLVVISWTNSGPAAGLSPTGYYVTRVRNSDNATFAACGSSAASPTATTPCNDTNVPDGIFHYQVTAVRASWTATSGSSNDVTVIKDVTPPSVTINQAAGQADPTNSGTVLFTATFSEPVTGFARADVTVAGTATGTGTVTITGTGPVYTVTISGMTGNGTIIATIGASTTLDLAGNNNTASTSTDNTVTLDTTRPSVTINQAAGQADPTNSGTVLFTATFSEPVTGFARADVTVAGTATGTGTVTITGTGPVYTVTISGMTGNGTIIATIGASTTLDLAGNNNTASTSTDNTVTLALALKLQYMQYDTINPTDPMILPGLQLVNTGSLGVSLSTITVRYWFTKDIGAKTFATNCGYATIDCSNVRTSVVAVHPARTGADSYLLVEFLPYTLAAGGSNDMRLGLNKTPYSDFNEVDDYSYGTGTSYTDWTKVTVYEGGTLIWGTEP